MRDTDTFTLALDRRGFLTSIGVAFATAPLTVMATCNVAGTVETPAHRAVYNQMPYISFDGTGEHYESPQGNRSTRDYVNSLSREEYLRRHWLI